MRNWYIFQLFHPVLDKSSDITYEELIPSCDDSYQDSPWEESCRTLPMRNWYILAAMLFFHCKDSSDITYEELIHVETSEVRVIFSDLMSDITYEELIHAVAAVRSSKLQVRVGHYLWGIDTDLTQSLPQQGVRRTLPMRNWYNVLENTYG